MKFIMSGSPNVGIGVAYIGRTDTGRRTNVLKVISVKREAVKRVRIPPLLNLLNP